MPPRNRRLPSIAAIAGASLAACAQIFGFDDLRASAPVCSDGGCDTGVSGGPDSSAVAEGGTPSSLACPDAAFFCDDFESGDTSKWGKRVSGSSSSIEATPAFAHAGLFGLRAATPANAGGSDVTAYVEERHVHFVEGMTYVARVYVDLSEPTGRGTLILLESTTDGANVRLAFDPTSRKLYVVSENATLDGGSATTYASEALSSARWQCVEWIVRVGVDGGQALLVNARPVLTTAVNTLGKQSNALDQTKLGIAGNGQPSVALRAGFDDVVLATEAVGCP